MQIYRPHVEWSQLQSKLIGKMSWTCFLLTRFSRLVLSTSGEVPGTWSWAMCKWNICSIQNKNAANLNVRHMAHYIAKRDLGTILQWAQQRWYVKRASWAFIFRVKKKNCEAVAAIAQHNFTSGSVGKASCTLYLFLHPAPVAPGLRSSLLASISTAVRWSHNFAGLITFSSWLNHQTSSTDFGGMNPEICSVFGKKLEIWNWTSCLYIIFQGASRMEPGKIECWSFGRTNAFMSVRELDKVGFEHSWRGVAHFEVLTKPRKRAKADGSW